MSDFKVGDRVRFVRCGEQCRHYRHMFEVPQTLVIKIWKRNVIWIPVHFGFAQKIDTVSFEPLVDHKEFHDEDEFSNIASFDFNYANSITEVSSHLVKEET